MGKTWFNVAKNWIILLQLDLKQIHKVNFYPSDNNFTQALLVCLWQISSLLYYCWDIFSSMFPFHPFHWFQGGPTLQWWLNQFFLNQQKKHRENLILPMVGKYWKWLNDQKKNILKCTLWSVFFLLRWTLQAIAEKAGKTLSEQVIFFFRFSPILVIFSLSNFSVFLPLKISPT